MPITMKTAKKRLSSLVFIRVTKGYDQMRAWKRVLSEGKTWYTDNLIEIDNIYIDNRAVNFFTKV